VAPLKPVPVIVTVAPTAAVVGENEVIVTAARTAADKQINTAVNKSNFFPILAKYERIKKKADCACLAAKQQSGNVIYNIAVMQNNQ